MYSTYEYKIRTENRQILYRNYINAKSLKEAHSKLVKEFPDQIICIDGIRFGGD